MFRSTEDIKSRKVGKLTSSRRAVKTGVLESGDMTARFVAVYPTLFGVIGSACQNISTFIGEY